MAWIIKASIILLFVASLGFAAEYIWYMALACKEAADHGRALELKAWEDFKIKREPGEPDAHLRRRCMAAADNELASTPSEKKERHDELDARLTAIRAATCAALNIPPEILCGMSKKDTQDKGESGNE